MPLYAFGSNGSGQLSLSHRNDIHVPEKCLLADHLGPPCSIAAGGNHTLALFPSGELYAVGNNSKKQCCLLSSIGYAERFTPVPPPCDADQGLTPGWGLCAAGWEFSILVSKDGRRIYSCGAGAKGELGLGPGIVSVLDIPTIIPNFPPQDNKIMAVSASLDHVVAVLDTGEVYGWGNSRKGQLGTATFAAIWQPTKIKGITFPVARVACGREFTFIINNSGSRHLVLGGNKWCLQKDAPPSSHGIKEHSHSTENGLSELEGYISVGASWGGIYVLLKDGTIKAWGRNDRGQLPPHPLPPVRAMAVGSEHVLAVIESDDNGAPVESLIAWGWGEHGNCATFNPSTGRGDDVVAGIHTVPLPYSAALKQPKIYAVGAGCATSWVWLDSS